MSVACRVKVAATERGVRRNEVFGLIYLVHRLSTKKR